MQLRYLTGRSRHLTRYTQESFIKHRFMSGTVKIIIWIVVAVVVLGGLYYWYTGSQSASPVTSSSENVSQESGPPTLPSGSDTSDSALEQDLSGLDTQMAAMSADTASIDSGLSDKQVPQEQ